MSKLARATFGLMVATIIAKILGFGRELVLAAGYGTSIYSDAYVTAMNIPQVIFAIIGSTLATVLIPMYMEVHSEEGEGASLEIYKQCVQLSYIRLHSIIGVRFCFYKGNCQCICCGIRRRSSASCHKLYENNNFRNSFYRT